MNGEVEIIDVTILQRYLVELDELSYEQLMLADVDDNGDVEVIDATILQRYLADMGGTIIDWTKG